MSLVLKTQKIKYLKYGMTVANKQIVKFADSNNQCLLETTPRLKKLYA